MLSFCLAEIILGAPKSSLRCCQKFQWWIVVNISKTLVISAKKAQCEIIVSHNYFCETEIILVFTKAFS